MSLLELSPLPSAMFSASRILVADDEPAIRSVCRLILEPVGMICDEARDGTEAVEVAASRPYDLVILDVDMPGMKGTEVCRRLRSMPTSPHLKILLVSGHAGDDEMAPMLLAGADDYLAKPFKGVQLRSRVVAALRLKVSQEDSDLINYRLNTLIREMEAELRTRDAGLHHARDTLAASLTRLSQSRDNETGMHMQRLARYSVRLAEEVAGSSGYVATVDREFRRETGMVGAVARHRESRRARCDPTEARQARPRRAPRDGIAHDHRLRNAPDDRRALQFRRGAPPHSDGRRPPSPRTFRWRRLP